MEILRRTLEHGSILPSAFGALASIPAQYLHHEAHGLRHPMSAYGTSLRLITAQWTKTLDDLDLLRTKYLSNREDDFLMDVAASYAALLHKLNEHHDACYSVLRSLSSRVEVKPTIVHTQYLDRVKLVGWKQFRDATRNYREGHIGLIVNALKHSQGELCPLYFYAKTEFRPGYYLRGVQPGGILGPDPRLHDGGDTAISFGRDMLVHLWWLYRASDLLVAAMTSFLNATHGHQLSPQPYQLAEAQWSDVVRRCSQIRLEFFPNEWSAPIPRVIFQPEPEQLMLEFPTSARGHRMLGDFEVRALTTLDGVHREERMPYFRRRAW